MRRIQAEKPDKYTTILALMLLSGLICVGTGFYSGSNPVLFIGILLIVAGVLNGILRIINRDQP
jgi:uncharacterized membrane protein HdeD (DUF308 family)